MNRPELQHLAQQYFIPVAGLSVPNLVRRIQLAEGHVDCFLTNPGHCDEAACRWRQECLADPACGAGKANDETTTPERVAVRPGNE